MLSRPAALLRPSGRLAVTPCGAIKRTRASRRFLERQIHVVLDNLNTHKPKHDRWLARHPNIHFHVTPTHASRLNQIEIWFSILARNTRRGASHGSVAQLPAAIDAFVAAYNANATPFQWHKGRRPTQGPRHKDHRFMMVSTSYASRKSIQLA